LFWETDCPYELIDIQSRICGRIDNWGKLGIDLLLYMEEENSRPISWSVIFQFIVLAWLYKPLVFLGLRLSSYERRWLWVADR
jgi:hypothetical protein